MTDSISNGHAADVIALPASRLLRERVHLVNLSTLPPPRVSELIHKLCAAAAEDNHCVLNPTHLMVRGSDIVGYLSLNGLPMVHCWFDSKTGHAADSLKMIEHGETAFGEHGVRDFTVACAEESPFTPHMERLGFVKLGTTVIWRKARSTINHQPST